MGGRYPGVNLFDFVARSGLGQLRGTRVSLLSSAQVKPIHLSWQATLGAPWLMMCAMPTGRSRLPRLSASLDLTTRPVEVFFRDDDAGWEDERLFELIARFAEHELPL